MNAYVLPSKLQFYQMYLHKQLHNS